MATLTKQTVSTAGLADSLASAAVGGDQFTNTGDEWLEALNGSGSSIDVTIATPATVNGEPIADRTVAVGAGVRKKIGPFNPSIFNDSSGYVQVTYSGVTSLTVGVFKLG